MAKEFDVTTKHPIELHSDDWMEESTTYQAIIEKGVKKGRVQGERELVLRLGALKFGPPDRASVAALEAISDPERLSALGERLLNAASWQELLS